MGSVRKLTTDNLPELLEPIVDKLTESATKALFGSIADVAKEEPFLKFGLLLLKTPGTASDAVFAHKFNKCFKSGGVKVSDLAYIDKKLSGSKKARFWKLVFTSIQSHDDEKKSELVGKIIHAYARQSIDYEEALAMFHAANRININNLEYLLESYQGRPGAMPAHVRQEFLTVGLFGMNQRPATFGDGGGTDFPLTDLGWKFTGIAFDYPKYKNHKSLKIGEGRLVGCFKGPAQMSNRTVLPFAVVKKSEYWYGEARAVARNKDKIWLRGSNPTIASSPIYAGEYGQKSLSNATGLKESSFTAVLSKSNPSKKITETYYQVDGGIAKALLKSHKGRWHKLIDLTRSSGEDPLRELADAIFKHDELVASRKKVK